MFYKLARKAAIRASLVKTAFFPFSILGRLLMGAQPQQFKLPPTFMPALGYGRDTLQRVGENVWAPRGMRATADFLGSAYSGSNMGSHSLQTLPLPRKSGPSSSPSLQTLPLPRKSGPSSSSSLQTLPFLRKGESYPPNSFSSPDRLDSKGGNNPRRYITEGPPSGGGLSSSHPMSVDDYVDLYRQAAERARAGNMPPASPSTPSFFDIASSVNNLLKSRISEAKGNTTSPRLLSVLEP